MCWEMTGCGRQDACKVLALAKLEGKPCWEVVEAFDDYRSALNVCGDCVVSVLGRQYSLNMARLNELKEGKPGSTTHKTCPGMRIS